MVLLSSCEIMDELKKLGITSAPDLVQYVIEYAADYSVTYKGTEILNG